MTRAIGAALEAHYQGAVTTIAFCVNVVLAKFQPRITDITRANPGAVSTRWAHGYATGDSIKILGVEGMTQVNEQYFTITVTGASTFTLGVDTSAYTAYVAGSWYGTARRALAFTNHVRDLTFNGVLYHSSIGGEGSSVSSKADLSITSRDVTAIIDSVLITPEDLERGLYSGAEYETFEVNYTDLTQGRLLLEYGRLGDITINDQVFIVEGLSLANILHQNLGPEISVTCRAQLGNKITDLYDERFGCKVRLNAPQWPGVGAQVAGNLYVSHTLTNPGAETGVTGWTNEIATLVSQAAPSGNWPAPHGGSNEFTFGSVVEGKASQRIDLVAAGVSAASIDLGILTFRMQAYVAGFATGADQGELRVRLLNSVPTQISETGSGLLPYSNTTWVLRTIEVPLVSGTRYVDIILHALRTGGTELNVEFDDITGGTYYLGATQTVVAIGDAALGAIVKPSIYNGCYFKCTTAGISGPTEPAWVAVVGSTTADGTAVWTAIAALIKQGVISSVTDRRTIRDSNRLEAPRYFNHGLLTFLTGNNKGWSSEIREFNYDVAPTFQIANTGTSISTVNNLTSAYPTSGVVLGDTYWLHVTIRNQTTTANTPAGWTLVSGPDNISTTGRSYIFGKVADLTETGNVTITFGADAAVCKMGRMYRIRAGGIVPQGAVVLVTGSSVSVGAPALTSISGNTIALAFVSITDDPNVIAFTGQTGGTWLEAAEFQTVAGLDGALQLQTAVLLEPATIAGGAFAFTPLAEWLVQAFILPVPSQYILRDSAPNVIQVADTYEVEIGCDKLHPTCIAKFNNIYNFRGEPYLPGFHKQFLYPNSTG